MQERVKTGSKVLDRMLEGGYEKGIITTIYGPAGSGKTLLCMLCAAQAARENKKVIYVDTEGSFSIERLKQIAIDHDRILNNMFFLRPTTFAEQKDSFEKLTKMISDSVGLVVVDTIAMLYRIELGKADDVYDVNRELGRQLARLCEIASKKAIPVLITNQVYSSFDDRDRVQMVGGDLLRYSSKCLLELSGTEQGNRKVELIKHRSIPSDRTMTFKIVHGGVIGIREKERFRLFS